MSSPKFFLLDNYVSFRIFYWTKTTNENFRANLCSSFRIPIKPRITYIDLILLTNILSLQESWMLDWNICEDGKISKKLLIGFINLIFASQKLFTQLISSKRLKNLFLPILRCKYFTNFIHLFQFRYSNIVWSARKKTANEMEISYPFLHYKVVFFCKII